MTGLKMMYQLVKFSTNRSVDEAQKIYKQRIEDALVIHERHKQNFVQRSCFLCGERDFMAVDDFHGSYKVKRCNTCASYSVNPAPNEAALNDYYNNGKCNLLLNDLLKTRYKKTVDFILDDRIRIVLNLIGEIKKKDVNLLEIGCSSGAFLAKLKHFIADKFPDKRILLAGIDIDANAIQSNVDKELELTVANAETFVRSAAGKYDIIVHFELIEHLIDPFSFMTNLHKLLTTNGRMLFSTPNADGLEMMASGYNDFRLLAHSIFPPMHLNAFSVANMTHFAIRCGFQVIEISTPGKLDIDMLTVCADEIDNEGLKRLTILDEKTKGLIQYLVTFLHGSGHMRCILKKKSEVSLG